MAGETQEGDRSRMDTHEGPACLHSPSSQHFLQGLGYFPVPQAVNKWIEHWGEDGIEDGGGPVSHWGSS